MKQKTALLVLLCVLLAACAFSGCIGDSGNNSTNSSNSTNDTGNVSFNNTTNNSTYNPATTITVTKDGVDIAANEKVQISFPTASRMGNKWEAVPTDGLNIQSDFIVNEDVTGGTTVFTITAKQAGSYNFTAVYKNAQGGTISTVVQKLDFIAPATTPAADPKLIIAYDGAPTPNVTEVIKIQTKGNPTTGYEWTALMSENGMLKLLDSVYVQDPSEPGMAGVGGIYEWYVTSDIAGTYTFDAQYARSWEDQPIDKFYIYVTFV
ncbi:hypothetical protein MsAg5_12830 [Methanosarcinaceae archaeon Ag5]|uniref:Proteinase inhibitor I42 chagasin domain-containing protein n=1 Tax=Methanolapillus africanus TaxID=3028297 RepID=A0AAE4MKC7_9EURY|nr:hypothetical protein [Methanosarcinaceae archaeon Ag5]